MIAVCALWLWALYYGFTIIVTKTIHSAPDVELPAFEDKDLEDVLSEQEQSDKAQDVSQEQKELEEDRKIKEQRERIQDTIQQQKELMEQRQRSMRYNRNR